MILVVGGDGFVGSAYVRLLEALGLDVQVVTRANYHQLQDTTCDLLINANGNSRKFMSDRDPKWDFDASVRSVLNTLEDFKSGAYIYLSSGDVYPEQTSPAVTLEDQIIDVRRQSRYGLHKYLAEQLVISRHPRPLVVRMGGFVGTGMKKNAIFDLLSNAPVWLTPDSALQFIRTDTAARYVWSLYCAGVTGEVVNTGAQGVVRIGDVHKRINSDSSFMAEARHVHYELSVDKLGRLTNSDLPTAKQEIEDYLGSIGR